MSKKISIITPAYNAERFISKCIRSVIKQSYVDWEMIIVDDGSRDNTLKICRKLERKDQRIRVFSIENSGASVARNYGIERASGELLTFLDSDDWLPKGALDSLYKALVENDAQMSSGSIKCVSAGKPYFISARGVIAERNDTSNFCASAINDKSMAYMAAKLFYTELIRANGIRFQKDMKVSEDSCFVLEYMKHINKIAQTNDVVYYYNRLLDSSVSQRFYINRIDWVLAKYKLQTELYDGDISKNEIKRLYADGFKKAFLWCVLHYIESDVGKEELCSLIIKSFEELYCDSHTRFLFEYKDDGDGFFACVRCRDAEGIYSLAKKNHRPTSVGLSLRIKRRIWRMIGKIKAWFIFKF